jgi:hypothetical protein
MTHAGRCFLCFRGKASTHLAYQFMTAKLYLWIKLKSTNYLVIFGDQIQIHLSTLLTALLDAHAIALAQLKENAPTE